MEHRNFLFGMERIRAKETEVCNKFNKLLGLEGCSGTAHIEEEFFKIVSQFSYFAFSIPKRMGEVEYLSSLTYQAEEFCTSSPVGVAANGAPTSDDRRPLAHKRLPTTHPQGAIASGHTARGCRKQGRLPAATRSAAACTGATAMAQESEGEG
ncbi:hypothetical protein GW17_00056559 [Ensete ventricosum]|nr:hypothetical protein GW17_00056559 [Ensete ventricosum]